MTPETRTFAIDLARLGESIAAHGIARYEAELATVAARARRSRVAETAADVLVDRTAPEVVRARAYAAVSRALSYPRRVEPTGPVALTAA